MQNQCAECDSWKPSHRKLCRVCRIFKLQHKITREQWAWIGPEPNTARRDIVLSLVDDGE